MSKDFATWKSEKDSLHAEAASKAAAEAGMQESQSAAKKDAAQAAFERWVVDKGILDRAWELMPQVGTWRGNDEEHWTEIGRALAHVDLYLRDAHLHMQAPGNDNPKRSMEYMFTQWTRKNHAYDTVTISAGVAKRFSRGYRAMMNDHGDTFEITGLSYVTQQKAKDFSQIKPMSKDDKLRNGIFSSMTRKAWASLLSEVQAAVDGSAGALVNGDGKPLPAAERAPIFKQRQAACMREGLYKLSKMVEDDREAAIKKAKTDAASKEEQGRHGHMRWVEGKEAVKIKLPPPDTYKEKPRPRFVVAMSNGSSVRVIKQEGPERASSASIVRAMGVGLKTGYAHATGEGESYDLLASRKALLDEGYVYLENFANPVDGTIDEEARAKYEEELATNKALQARLRAEEEKKARDKEAFDNWIATKEGADLARECMQLLPVVLSFDSYQNPQMQGGANGGAGGGTPSRPASRAGTPKGTPTRPGTARRPSVSTTASLGSIGATTLVGLDRPLLSRAPTEDEHELWRAVGYACKAVDRCLLQDFIKWSAPLFGKQDCIKEWATFKPINHGKEKEGDDESASPRGRSASRGRGMRESKSSSPTRAAASAAAAASSGLYKAPKPAEVEVWTPADRNAALKLLHVLSIEHRRLAAIRQSAAEERPPALPVFRRKPTAEALPTFLHGHEGAIRRASSDLAIPEGSGVPLLGGTGVGSEIVLQWFVGEDDVEEPERLGAAAIAAAKAAATPKAEGAASSSSADSGFASPDKMVQRLQSAHAASYTGPARQQPVQPPYVMVLETCGPAGGSRAREGQWTRVMLDPPDAMPLLASVAGTSYVPLSGKAQGQGQLPPPAGDVNLDWESNPQKPRGCIRITGLMPNTTYCYRVRAYNRQGAGPYAFGVFTTAACPPPAPILALPSLAPRALLSDAATGSGPDAATDLSVAPTLPDSVTVTWEKRVDYRVGLLRLLRVFYASAAADRANRAAAKKRTGSTGPKTDEHGITEYDEYEEDPFGDDALGGLFSSVTADRGTLVRTTNKEAGLRAWLMACVASADFWPAREDDGSGSGSAGAGAGDEAASSLPESRLATTRPASVWEALLSDTREALSWADVLALFSDDETADDPLDLLLAGSGSSSGGSGLGGPGSPSREKPRFKLSAGGSGVFGSMLAAKTLAIKRGMTVSRSSSALLGGISRPNSATARARENGHGLDGTAGSALLGGTAATTSSGVPPRPMSARSGAASTVGRALNALDHRRGSVGSGSMTSSVARLTAAGSSAAETGLKYAMLQCLSDGPRGQEWAELYVGMRTLRRVDKLLPGTSYAFRVQAINRDGQASVFGPVAVVTTALPAPANLRISGKLLATTVTLTWDAVSAANALTTMRAIGGGGGGGGAPEASSPGRPDSPNKEAKKGTNDPAAAADIDAVLQALLAKGKAEKKEKEASGSGGKKAFTPASALVPIREGDGGVGVDLRRMWINYDPDFTGFITQADLRGLLTDLGAYYETTSLVQGASDASAPAATTASSLEQQASTGQGDWRLHAAVAALDPKSTGTIPFGAFSDWWNSVDAALEKARAARAPAAGPRRSRPTSARSGANNGSTGGAGGAGGSGEVTSTDITELSAAVVYVLESRRLLSDAETAATAAAAMGATSSSASHHHHHHPPRPMSGTARSALNTPATAVGAEALVFGTASLSSGSNGPAGTFTPWQVVYMGSSTRFKMADLLPNGQYQFRISVISRHAFSSPSKTLNVNMPPLAPFAPVIVRTGPRSVSLRWYAGELGADKFEVQAKIIEALLPPNAVTLDGTAQTRLRNDVPGNARGGVAGTTTPSGLYVGRNISEAMTRRLATSRSLAGAGAAYDERTEGDEELWTEDPDGEGWGTVYTGTSAYTCITGLYSNTVYRFRVLAYNANGVASRPSAETQVITIDNSQYEGLTVGNANKHFVVECSPVAVEPHAGTGAAAALPVLQDLVVGDTVLFTEDVYVDSGPDPDPYHPQPPKEVHETHPRARFLCSRTVAATILGDTASKLSAASGHSAGIGSPHGPVAVGAASVLNLSANATPDDATVKSAMARTLKSMTIRSGGSKASADANAVRVVTPATTMEEALSRRTLSLQVDWCTVSASRAASYVLPHGAIAKRAHADIAALDVYRCMWEDESGRWSLAEEVRASFDR